MQRLFSNLKQAFRQSFFIFSLISLIGLSSLFIFSQPSLAAAPTERQPTLERGIDNAAQTNQAAHNRVDTYEKAVKAVDDPQGLEKAYEKNLGKYEEKQPDNGIIQEASKIIEKVTGQD
ncbi:hypothetical protein H6S82_30195 [Planktothrix sp. FACHB-1355]|uniref:Uncharacterized protein n=1 Tax=Aerosakkonema funiforme FACHB-1375 TaxID=2949571 RepID=A0A926VKI4_9CYAN|nr:MULTISPECIES: hypothetical protein [Oscillatoriales]MBD2185434.1 hypothetical protein [Aerosakkonema funiforme FACHB-1375]MBD3563082.1 hypothetical protein [Planktothrix sp. FACHB-1355]